MDGSIDIDLFTTRADAENIRGVILNLRRKYDLARYEYTKNVRISPGEVPHSHPVLTLNTRLRTENPLLCTYLHEQMHWYATWYSHTNTSGWRSIWSAIRQAFPSVPISFPEGAHSEHSSYLHIIVNYLEIEAAGDLLGPDVARDIACKNFVYRGIYEIVLREWASLTALYRSHALIPIRPASEMSEGDLHLAAQMDEAPVD